MNEQPATWVVLVHTPGPSADGPFFQDPRFAHHREFLRSMAERSWLVAAGPLTDTTGEGMTVLRVPDENGLALATELAEADRSVAEGLFSVRVRPWNVVQESSRFAGEDRLG